MTTDSITIMCNTNKQCAVTFSRPWQEAVDLWSLSINLSTAHLQQVLLIDNLTDLPVMEDEHWHLVDWFLGLETFGKKHIYCRC